MTLPKIGYGTYKIIDNQEHLVYDAIKCGYKLIDTATNYNNGNALYEVSKAIDKIQDADIILSSKVGFVANEELKNKYLVDGIISDLDCILNHSLNPTFIEREIYRSFDILKRRKIDVLFLHNPEVQLKGKTPKGFIDNFYKLFEILEIFRDKNIIESYGVATWKMFYESDQISLDQIYDIAREVGGVNNGFRNLQTPLSLVNSKHLYDYYINSEGLIKTAKDLGLSIFASSPLNKGSLLSCIDANLREYLSVKSNANACLAFLNSIQEIDTVLTGASNKKQLLENINLFSNKGIERERVSYLLQLLQHE